jgi:hypothetical protein
MLLIAALALKLRFDASKACLKPLLICEDEDSDTTAATAALPSRSPAVMELSYVLKRIIGRWTPH